MEPAKKPTDEDTCFRKRKYVKKKAKHVLKLLRSHEKGVHGSIYKCHVCGYYHITSWHKKLYNKVRLEKTRHNTW